MPSHALPADVAVRLGRPLTEPESDQIEAYLADAEAKILGKVSDALTRAGVEPVYSAILKAVECSIALRAARITDAVQAAYPGTEDWSTPPGSSRANVTVLDTEWRALGLPWYTSFSLTPGPDVDNVWPSWYDAWFQYGWDVD